jgi:uncharacterized membrane protein
MNDLVISTIRTLVPTFVGTLVTLLAGWGIAVDGEAAAGLQAFVFAVTTAAYYLAVRLLAQKFPKLEWLLGAPKKPVYKEV